MSAPSTHSYARLADRLFSTIAVVEEVVSERKFVIEQLASYISSKY